MRSKEGGVTSRSIMSRGKGTSGFSPVSTIGMSAFFISFSTNPVRKRKRWTLMGARSDAQPLLKRSPADGGQVERGCISLTQLAIHLFAPSHFIDELALEDVDVRIQLQGRQQRARVRPSS